MGARGGAADGWRHVKMLRFEVPDEPLPMKRPRVTIRGGQAHAYTPSQSLRAEDRIRVHVAQQLPDGWEPIDTAVSLGFTAWLPMPKAIPKRDRASAKPTRRPDLPNFVMLLADGLQGVVYTDDSRITRIDCRKDYARGRLPGWSVVVLWEPEA